MVQAIKDWLGIIREVMIIVAVAMILIFPTQVGAWLFARGVQKIEIGGATVSLTQFNQTREALNAVQDAQNAAPAQKAQQLQTVATKLQAALVDQVESLSRSGTAGLPTTGWIYLGTLNEGKTDWKPKISKDVANPWPIKLEDIVVLSVNTNLRSDSTSELRPTAPILSALPLGTKVRVLSLDTDRKVADDSPDRPGYRAWAKVEVVH
jgi:hypothetical protein